jgi:arylsulfatase A
MKPLASLLIVVLTSIACATSLAARPDGRPNMVLILADDLGYEALSCNGGLSYQTPSFDRLAKSAMRFTHCYSQPICTPSRNKIMTGRSNARNYVGFGMLRRDEITFGTVMRQANYRTAIAGKWQLTGAGNIFHPDDRGYGTTPTAGGFEQSCLWAYDKDLTKQQRLDYYAQYPAVKRKRTSRYWHPAILQNEKLRPTTINDFGPDIYAQFLMDFIEQHRDEPFFVYYPMALTHNPFVPPPGTANLTTESKLQNDIKNFGPLVDYTGVIIERILAKLEQLGLAENTLVMFTADNGSYRSIVSRTADRVIIGGKALPIDAGIHVPLLAWWKGHIAAGSVCHDLIEFSDFFPTIVEAGGAELPSDRPLDGRSFLARLRGDDYAPRTSIFVHYDKDPESQRPQYRRVRYAFDGRYKLYLDGQLFDVQQDPEERRPLTAAEFSPEITASRASLQTTLDAMPAWSPDNSHFGGRPDPLTRQRHQQLREQP